MIEKPYTQIQASSCSFEMFLGYLKSIYNFLEILLMFMPPTYLTWEHRTLPHFTPEDLDKLYNEGYVATRIDRGVFKQTRSLRINLATFSLSSENRRILKKTDGLNLTSHPIPYVDYTWTIGKLAKDFYTEKFGDGTFSANKIKELLTEPSKSSFNKLLVYTYGTNPEPIGYCVTLETEEILHYCYPFYQLRATSYELPANLGLGMMLRAIITAQEEGKKYIYLGSLQRPSDTYKLQFEGLEWFDSNAWQTDIAAAKNLLAHIK